MEITQVKHLQVLHILTGSYLASIRLGWKKYARGNTLAYFFSLLVTKKKVFVT
jgi:hypothetical protein